MEPGRTKTVTASWNRSITAAARMDVDIEHDPLAGLDGGGTDHRALSVPYPVSSPKYLETLQKLALLALEVSNSSRLTK